MIFLKNYFIATTAEVDAVIITHDVRFAIHDSKAVSGLATIFLPTAGAGVVVSLDGALLTTFYTELAGQLSGGAKEQVYHLIPRYLTIPFEKGELLIAPKENIFIIDAGDTVRRREYRVHIYGADEEKKPAGPAPRSRR